MGRPRILSVPHSLLQGGTKAGTGLGGTTQVLAVGLGRCIYCVRHKGTQPTAGWERPPTPVLVTWTKVCLLQLVLPEESPFSIGSSREGTFFLLALPEGRPFSIGCHREGTFYYWSSQRWWLLLFYTKLPYILAVALEAGFPRCWALVSSRAGWSAVALPSTGPEEGPWQSSLGDRRPLPLAPAPGRVHFQRRADDPSHHGELRLPQVGPGRGLAHGSVFHGSHPRIHGLHVPHLKGLPEAGKPVPCPSCRWAPSLLC